MMHLSAAFTILQIGEQHSDQSGDPRKSLLFKMTSDMTISYIHSALHIDLLTVGFAFAANQSKRMKKETDGFQ